MAKAKVNTESKFLKKAKKGKSKYKKNLNKSEKRDQKPYVGQGR